MDLASVHRLSFNTFKPLGQLNSKFHMETPEGREIKVNLRGPGHMTKIAAMPIYGIMASQIGFLMHLNGNFLKKLIFQYLLKPVINPMYTGNP